MSSRAAARTFPPIAVAIWLGACGGGGGSGRPITPRDHTPEIVFCRSRTSSSHNDTVVRSATRFGLADRRVIDRSGIESGVRIAPDGVRIVYARERRLARPDSRELFVATLDGSQPEQRLTSDGFLDDSPCWVDAGTAIVFSSDRTGAGRRLYRVGADGAGLTIVHDDGSEQRDPDWSATTRRIVYSAIPSGGSRARLFTIDRDGRTPIPLTDGGSGGATGEPPGDREPAWSPDGTRVVFSRSVGAGTCALFGVEVATGAVTALTSGPGQDRWPRWSPAGDALWFARSRPLAGMPGFRLTVAAADGGEPRLVFPDERYDYLGFDPLPAMAAVTPTGDWLDVELADGAFEVSFGRRTLGDEDSLRAADGDALGLETRRFGNRDIAGLGVRARAPTQDAEDVVAIEIAVLARLEPDDDSLFRLAIANHVAGRNDTTLEVEPGGSDFATWRVTLQSQAHVSRRSEIEFDVIADLPPDARGTLLVDHVAVRVRLRRGGD